MRWRLITPIVPILFHQTLNLWFCVAEPFNDESNLPASSASSLPIVIPNAINNVTATIVVTPAVGNTSAKTWISFDDGPMFEVDDELRLESIEAAYNKTARKKHRGSGDSFAHPVCVFDSKVVKAKVSGPSTLFCEGLATENAKSASIPLHISSNGGLDGPTLGRFAYLSSQERRALHLDPNHGPSSGGTRVVVRGIRGAPIVRGQQALCKFGSQISQAIEVDPNGEFVVCTSPPKSTNGHASSVPVDVSASGHSNIFLSMQVVFRYDDDFSLSSLYPASGLVIGGTKVNVRGGPFQNPDEILCRFGDQVVNATYHDVAEISCSSPHLGWIDEVQRVSVFTMAANPEIQTISATVDDYVNEVHICKTFGQSDLADDDLGRGFRLVAPGGSFRYPLSHHTRWVHFNETADGMKDALSETGLFPYGFHVDRTGPFPGRAYTWEIILPKNESFNGETLHVVNTGGGAVKLTGTNASVSCLLAQRGTTRLEGQFKLTFVNNGLVESSRPIYHNSTNDDIKQALEEINGIDRVKVNSASLDLNMTGSGAFQWHVTFDSLKNSGDLPLLTAQYSSSGARLFGSNAAINVKETRKGSSHAIYRFEIPSQAAGFSIYFDGTESKLLSVNATAAEVGEAIALAGTKSIVVERFLDEYFFLDIMGYPLEGRLKARFFNCTDNDTSSSCDSELQSAVLHALDTATQLGGHFSLRYPSYAATCKKCLHYVTEPISVFGNAKQLESALQKLDLVDSTKVVVTESDRFQEYKVAVESGIVGRNRHFYIHFIQTKFNAFPNLYNNLPFSTGFTGDVPLLEIMKDVLKGTPTRDGAYSNDYNAIVTEVVKGTDLNHGGNVEVAVSINGGVDFSVQHLLYEYKPLPIVRSITPAYGGIGGNTALRVAGFNFFRQSARLCLFWDVDGSISDGILVPISKHVFSETGVANKTVRQEDKGIAEVLCMTPASLKPRYVQVAVVSKEDISTLGGLLQARGALFRYHEGIKVSSIYPLSSLVTGNVSVIVFGGPFFSNEGLFCAFGERSVPGLFLGPSQISCTTPPHAAGKYSLEVTQNGQEYTKSGHVFRYYHPCKVINISPISGPSKKAGTNVKVYGENFVNSSSLQCRFGLLTVPATFVRSSEIFCSAPPIEDGALEYTQPAGYYPQRMRVRLVSFEVSNNGQDFTAGGHEFLYMKDINALHMSRREGPSHGGGTPVILSGKNFVNSTQLTCRFGKEPTPAYFLTQDAVLCFSPVQGTNYINPVKEKALPLAVSNNAADFVVFGGFTYASRPPTGTYQAGTEGKNTLLSCPRGAYCDGMLSTNFTLCNPGTFQPLTGQTRCHACPIGYSCNEFGMTAPRICPAHYVCDETRLSNPKPCPTNFICDKGTATLATAFNFGAETCFDNATDDFGLQASGYLSKVWAERHLMPLDATPLSPPVRGRFCNDDSRLSYRDTDNFQVLDKSFDYSSTGFVLRRPTCIEGTDCKPGISPLSHSCSKGHYCRHGKKKPCRVGTYCPHEKVFDPIPCEPGTFNFMIGQVKCSECPIGYYCPINGLLDPVICSPGYVCSKKGLASPNIRCPAGLRQTRSEMTRHSGHMLAVLAPFVLQGLAPTRCMKALSGLRSPVLPVFSARPHLHQPKDQAHVRPLFNAQRVQRLRGPLQKDFTLNTLVQLSPPPVCLASTRRQSKLRHVTNALLGHLASALVLPAFEGLYMAEECGPGTYRSTDDDGGNSCLPCPQGTWSKNWGLREKGECTRCPTGVVCPVDGMTNPCSYADLPTPYEPVVNYRDMPAFEYAIPTDLRPPPFSIDECLALNTKNSLSTEYFFGELIPPYIDILGRGPHFRASDQSSLKYQSIAKCYKNSQPHGSAVYMRMADYYGPQYDIQTGHPHQGYGIALLNNQIYATAPPRGFDYSFNYFRGEGNGYIDLPKARFYDPAFNCTNGVQLMNSSLVKNSKQVVYTDPVHDFEGGEDVEKCPTLDSELGCYVDQTYQLHAKGGCCTIGKFKQRAVYLAHDQFYKGTCEADIICSEGGFAPTQAKPCDSGFVCDERTSVESSMYYRCPAGFLCDFATTPDTNLHAPGSQLKNLCKEGHYCGGDDLIHPRNGICPENHWCPTGTADPHTGALANDGLLRLLHNTLTTPVTSLQYQGGDTFVLLDNHDAGCNAATRPSVETRFKVEVLNHTNINYIKYISDQRKLDIVVNKAAALSEQCARDHKSTFIRDAIRRKECNCNALFLTLASVYRFWKCTSNKPLENLGMGDATMSPSDRGMRDFWHPHSRIHKLGVAIDPANEVSGLQYGDGSVCKFSDSDHTLSLIKGRLPDEGELPNVSALQTQSSNYLEISANDGFSVRFTIAEVRIFGSYAKLKDDVRSEYNSEREQIASGGRSNIDPHIFDLYNALKLIEQFGQKLEQFVYLNATNTTSTTSIEFVLEQGNDTDSRNFDFVGPLDWCECQNLLRCPNATKSDQGSSSLAACISSKDEVLHRISLLPSAYKMTTQMPSTEEGTVDESTTLTLKPYDVAILTIDHSHLPNNLTYGDHYRIAIYDGCKPCPIRYRCKKTDVGSDAQPSACLSPAVPKQVDSLNKCLKRHRKKVCLRADGSHDEVATCQRLYEEGSQNVNYTSIDPTFVFFTEPDLDKCLSRPYFCSDTSWNFLSYRRLCQDNQVTGDMSHIYDCFDVHRWQIYNQWRDKMCCSQVPELRGIDSCQNSVCVDNPLIEKIIWENLIGVFESEFGYIPPTKQPKGQLLMNAGLQEEIDHEHPFDLFNEYQQPFKEEGIATNVSPHNKNNPESSQSWMTTPGCCECHRHSMPAFFSTNSHASGFPDDKHQPIQLSISALAKVDLTVVVELLHGGFYSDFSDYFGSNDKTMLRVHSPSRFGEISDDLATWLAVMEKTSLDELNLDLPLNFPTNVVEDGITKEMENRFLVDRPSNSSIGDDRLVGAFVSNTNINGRSYSVLANPPSAVLANNKLWQHDFLALPYLPFFSNCDGYDSHISLSRLLEEHPDCQQVSHDEAMPTKEFSGRSPVGDKCLGVVLNCNYEEEVREARSNLRWFEASPGSILFHITREAIPSNLFVPSTGDEEWGRTSALNELRDHGLIPVSIGSDKGGHRHAIPRKVKLQLKYFQVSTRQKRLVEANLYFYDMCTTQKPKQFGGSANILGMMNERGIFPCDVDVNGNIKSQGYDLEIQYYPLAWFDLVNDFEFGGSVYLVFFTFMGLTIFTMGGFVYMMNRLLTKLRHPPQFMGLSFVKLVAWPQISGVGLAVVPYTAAILLIQSSFNSPTLTFPDVHRNWLDDGVVSDKEQIENDMGRLGSALIVLGFYSIWRALQYLIPATQASRVSATSNTDDQAANLVAKRARFIWVGLSVETILMCLWEFSYSDDFRNNIYRFKVVFQLCQMMLDMVTSHIMGDRLLAAPLLVSIQMAELLVTIGARNFVEFSLCFLVEISMIVFQRLFLYPLIRTILTLLPRWRLLANQAFGSKGLTRQDQQERELMWKKVNEDIELRSEGVEPLLDSLSLYTVEKIGSILFPVMCLLLMLLYNESEMAKSYNINQQELLYYGLFAFFMIPWISLLDCFVLSSQELLYGWRVFDYFSYQRWRFANRESRWNLLAHVDESVKQSLQNVDLLCFSSQYYFILSIIALGFGTNMIGITICIRRKFNFLGDPVFPLIVVVVVACFELIAQICVFVSNTSIDAILWGGIWKVAKLQGTMDDVIASKLAVGEGRQEDLEQERQELLAMNSESFRHKFIEKNRPWMLSHLVELITPRSLQEAGPDGRPLIDYVRDVYSNLMNVGEGINRRADDRSDISSDDSSDDEEEKRRQWDRTPLEGSKHLIAQIWFQKARKRRVFAQAVAGVIEKRKEDQCTSCSRTLGQCNSLTAGLAWNNRFDQYAIDSLIKLFEDSYSPGESNLDLWKAFFRENARFSTCCNICFDQIEQQKLHKDVRHVGAGAVTRPGDISSDEESDDDKLFDPVLVVRSSDEGKMMSKWLQGAREKLGGDFPRTSAVTQTERYLEKLKRNTPTDVKVADRADHISQIEKDENGSNSWGNIDLNETGEFIIKRWLTDAKRVGRTRFEQQSKDIRSQLHDAIGSLDVEDTTTRMEGTSLKIEGDQITKLKESHETELSKQLDSLRSYFDLALKEFAEREKEKTEESEASLSQFQTLSQRRQESRTLELNKLIDISTSEEETAALRSLLTMEIEDEDRLLQSKINELKTQVADSLKRLDRERHSTLNSYERDCQVLTGRMRKEDVNRERDWQKRVNLWVGKTSRASSVGGRRTLNNSSANSDRRIEKMNVPSEADNEVVN